MQSDARNPVEKSPDGSSIFSNGVKYSRFADWIFCQEKSILAKAGHFTEFLKTL